MQQQHYKERDDRHGYSAKCGIGRVLAPNPMPDRPKHRKDLDSACISGDHGSAN